MEIYLFQRGMIHPSRGESFPFEISIYLGIFVIHWTKVQFMSFTKTVYVMNGIFETPLDRSFLSARKCSKTVRPHRTGVLRIKLIPVSSVDTRNVGPWYHFVLEKIF